MISKVGTEETKVMGRVGQRSRNVTRLIDHGMWEKNHADMGIMCQLHTGSGTGQELIFIFSSMLQ